MTYAGLRQVEALRESVLGCLRGDIIDERRVAAWLENQGISDQHVPNDYLNANAPWFVLDTRFAESIGERLSSIVKATHAPTPEVAAIGSDRSGAGWAQLDNFILSSAFVRLLGAGEQFELDVLKSLFYYRPSGLLGPVEEQTDIVIDHSILLEEPEVQGDKRIYRKPPVWTWLRKQAENNHERKRIFSNVYGLKTIPNGYTDKQRDTWYEKRNAIALGRQGVRFTLVEYSEALIFVVKSMFYLSYQCHQNLKLIV